MAGGEAALTALKYVPLAVGGAGAIQLADFVAGDEDSSNKAMDLLGMGGGAAAAHYGMNLGPDTVGGSTVEGSKLAGRTPAQRLFIIASALGGKTAMDTLQGD